MSFPGTVSTEHKKRKLITAIICISITFLLLGCTTHQNEIRAYAVGNLNWKMVEGCGYENCDPMVDYLTGDDTTIRLEFDKMQHFFVIRITFISNVNRPIVFDPKNLKIMLKDEGILKPRVFSCSYTMWDLDYLRISPSLQNPVNVKNDCFLLFFDHPGLSLDEEVIMDINSALSSSGKQLVVPLIYFRKNPGKPLGSG